MPSKIRTPNWYVVTGGPSSGITSLVFALKPHTDKVFPEAARVLIDRNLKKGISVAKTRANEGSFQRKVLAMKLRTEARARKDRLSILDRGVPDSIPYFVVAGLDPKPIGAYSRNRYRAVFFLDPLPYDRDYARTETATERRLLSKLLLKTYREFGYRVIRIPALPVKQRVNLVLRFLKNEAKPGNQS